MSPQSVKPQFVQKEPFPWREELESSSIDLTVMVPCYNEETNIADTLTLIGLAADQVGCSLEVIVIDDGSTDKTSECVRQFQEANPTQNIRLLTRLQNEGLARGFVDGAFMARGRHYRLVCGDNVEPVETLAAVFRRIGAADIILPYHSHVDGRHPGRIALSGLYTRLINVLSGNNLRYYNGCPLFRTWDVLRWHVDASGFGFQAEFLCRLLDNSYSYEEIAVRAVERRTGKPRALTLRNWMSAGHTLFKISMRSLRRILFR